jgi:hypothetical protein
VTFHPSFSYEEFVEGIRPVAGDGQVRYEVRAGVFKQVASRARELFEAREAPAAALDLAGKALYKMSLGDSTNRREDWIYPDCLENSYICLGFGDGIDFLLAITRIRSNLDHEVGSIIPREARGWGCGRLWV